MIHDFPDDSDGVALRLVADDGSDMSMPMFIDFHVAMPDENSADAFGAEMRKLAYHVDVYDSDECKLPWTCECSTRMLATYDGVIAIQQELAARSEPFGGFPDGWGTFGNGPTGQPTVNE